jgi:serine/threonine protein kinase
MGTVFKARHSLMNRVVALKVIRRERLTGPQAVARFHREIRAAALLSHPNIVMALDAAQVGDGHFLVMEYVPGVDLARLLGQRGKLPAGEACDYAYQAALGLQHAHENGMVHRDIKPANLLRADRGHVVKILDMGLARLAGEQMLVGAGAGAGNDQLTGTGLAMGTLDYIAPEQIDDAHSVDIRADIYSLGCTLFHLLAGRAPYWHHKESSTSSPHIAAEHRQNHWPACGLICRRRWCWSSSG